MIINVIPSLERQMKFLKEVEAKGQVTSHKDWVVWLPLPLSPIASATLYVAETQEAGRMHTVIRGETCGEVGAGCRSVKKKYLGDPIALITLLI